MSGIVSYGTYIPSLRVKVAEIASFWERDPQAVTRSLGIKEKAVPSIDEDAATLAVEASYNAMVAINCRADSIEALLIGSESHPYAVKPTSTTVGEILGISKNYLSVDTQFACKAGTAAMILVAGLVDSGKICRGMIVGSDTAQAKPGDTLEYTAGAASATFILGNDHPLAKLADFASYSSNTPDFWRRDGQKYPAHGGRFTGEPAYFDHVIGASLALLKKTRMKPSDFDFVVFHMPNSKFPKEAAKRLGFSDKQLAPGLIVEQIGNPYSASSLLGLAKVLDTAKPDQKIFVCSYGSGAGSDAFIVETTKHLLDFQKNTLSTVKKQIEAKRPIDYPSYVKIFKSKEYI